MAPPARATNLIEYTSFAATTLREIARSAQIPFLLTAASLTGMILDCVRAVKTAKESTLEIVAQIHEILCAIISLYSENVVSQSLPPSLLYDIGRFTETLQKIFTLMKAQQEMGKIKQLLKHTENALQWDICKAGLQAAMDALKIQTGASVISGIAKIQNDVDAQHRDLLELLAAHQDIASSEYTSAGVSSTFSTSVESFAMFPASPKIFHGRETELDQIMRLLSQEVAHIAILGPGGMGKTSLALATLHHPDTASKYTHRYFVPCHSTPSYSELVATIASHLGVEQDSNLTRGIIEHFSNNPASFLILDNFETPWEPLDGRADVEEFLSLLADVPGLAILITLRGAERPAKVKWTRPCPLPLAPLSEAAALQTFIDIADESQDVVTVKHLLDLTGNLPLAVSLIANVAAYEGCEAALARWRTENTHLLSDGYDKTSSLDISIMLSISSTRMDAEAQKLLTILSMLPDGLSDADLVQSALPISNIRRCKATLMRTSLAYNDHGQRLKVLVPIREYVYTVHPPSPEMTLAARQYFHTILELWDGSQRITPQPNSMPQIAANFGNLNRLFSDAMQREKAEEYPDMLASLRSTILLSRFSRISEHVHSPVMAALERRIPEWKGHPVYGSYLVESLASVLQSDVKATTEVLIESGHRFFETPAGAADTAKWHNIVAHYYYMSTEFKKAIKYRQSALALAATDETQRSVAMEALLGISTIMGALGDHAGSKFHAHRARGYADSLGDVYAASQAAAREADASSHLGDFRSASRLCAESRELARACGMEGSIADLNAQIFQAEIHMLKTEYPEARALNEHVIAVQPRTYKSAFADLNLALIGTATGDDAETIRAHAQVAQGQFMEQLDFPLGLELCNVVYADLHLAVGNTADARVLITTAFYALRDTLDEGAVLCLERLADLGTGMYSAEQTLNWAAISLASAHKSNNRLAKMKAVRYLGDILAALDGGDLQTALHLFEVALEGFTLMGVHGCAADCMVRISGILERRGGQEREQAVDLLRQARTLFGRSSQLKQVSSVDARLKMLAPE
ncbi:hypothetical protein C8R46DRAFT_1352719 [Mycena filopes]|nr:hypothetical protein C8R46DRAFT_1352719 [Mycena filopes]